MKFMRNRTNSPTEADDVHVAQLQVRSVRWYGKATDHCATTYGFREFARRGIPLRSELEER
ncbi:hypothetical protein M407DRAFT_244004 [Tulasnella calospora MUT 4182]|uniref:Uncharacterized protein n=1 Tax=Tulasnella calospora MUT 4182 TaxID=1051891 RepID=A0A0C3KVU3_9AGAM|nr:hypothetical protein M407DRAFT_244004 [Tulasnella calospora MUT 4182]